MKVLKKLIIFSCLILIIGIIYSCSINEFMLLKTKKLIIEDYSQVENVDCILVLGAGVEGDNPSPMLEDRLKKSIELYEKGFSNKIIMSGDHGRENYDEVNVMKKYVLKQNVPSKDVFMDHAGFSTYESVYRAKEIFGIKKLIIISQEYHLPRALYIAEALGLEAYGISAEKVYYEGQQTREFREFLARNKDFILSITKPTPKYLGKTISILENGNITNN